jgi:hypothetical protein
MWAGVNSSRRFDFAAVNEEVATNAAIFQSDLGNDVMLLEPGTESWPCSRHLIEHGCKSKQDGPENQSFHDGVLVEIRKGNI